MKKTLLVVLFAIYGTCAFSQNFDYGVKAGLNFSSFGNKVESGKRTGMHAGILAEYHLNEKFAFGGELLYSELGADEIGKSVSYEGDEEKLTYLVLPIMAKYYVSPEFSIEAGPQIGCLLDKESSFTTDYTTNVSHYKTIDVGFNAGVGMYLPVGIFFQFRYTVGLTKNLPVSPTIEKSVPNNNFQISTGFRF